MLVCFLLLSGQHLSHFLLIMVTSLKQRGCVVAVAFLGVLSLSQGQTNPAPAGPAQPPDPIKPADHPQMLLAQALVQAASPAAASTTKSTTTSSAVAIPALTEADATVESGGVGVREFQGDDVGQVLRLLARQAKVNMVVSDAVTGTVTMRLEDVTALQAISIIVKAKGLFMDKIDNIYYIKTAGERTAEPTATATSSVTRGPRTFRRWLRPSLQAKIHRKSTSARTRFSSARPAATSTTSGKCWCRSTNQPS